MDTDNRSMKAWAGRGQWKVGVGWGLKMMTFRQDKGQGSKTAAMNVSTKAG